MPKNYINPDVVCKHCMTYRFVVSERFALGASRFPIVLALVLLLALCPAVPVSAGDTVELNGGVVTGGLYPGNNLWHNAPGFSYWGDSLTPYGEYSYWPGNYGTSAENLNRSYSLDGNTVILHNGTVDGSIYGAINDTLASDPRPHDVTNNRIIIYDGTVGIRPGTPGNNFVETTSGNLFGGWTNAGQALNNRVDIYSGMVYGSVYGGLSKEGHANDNTVFIGGSVVQIGGSTINVTDVEGWVNDWVNFVSIPANEPSFEGAIAELATRLGLTRTPADEAALVEALVQELGSRNPDNATIAVGGNVYGGSSSGGGDALRNTVTMTSGSVVDYLYGGYSIYGATSENTVDISGGDVGQKVYGGYTRGDSAISNKVILSGDAMVGAKLSGWGGYVYGGWTDTPGGVIGSNEVTLSGNAQVRGVPSLYYGLLGGSVYGGYAESFDTTIQNNTVILSGNVVVDADVAGGYTTRSGVVIGNTVTLYNGSVGGNVYGGFAGKNYPDNATASWNTVSMSGGTVAGDVYGGRAYSDWNEYATASNNTVTISDGKVNGNLYAGYAVCDLGDAIASNNTLTISGNPVFGANTILYGGYADGVTSTSADNTFNLHSRDVTVAGLQDFQVMNFFLPTSLGNGDIMLDVTNSAAGSANIDNAVANVYFAGSSTPLRAGDHAVLINTPNDTSLTGETSNTRSLAKLGVTLTYDFEILRPLSNRNQLWALLRTDPTVNPQTEDFSKGFLTGMSLLNQGSDLVSWHGMSGAVRAAREARHCGYGIFFDMTGGRSRYDTGCHVDLTGLSLIAGVAKYRNLGNGHLTLGAFFEYGNGSYDTYNTFVNADPVHGNGNLHYHGGGLLGRLDFCRIGSRHYYTEASFRAGGISNRYLNADIRDALGQTVSYDSGSAYYGMHVGVGKYWQVSDGAAFDLYTKYLWTGLQGDSVTLSTGEPVDFQSVNSHRLRLGGRYTNNTNKSLTPYFGGAWEYEFAGDARAATNGYAFDVPSLRGSTGIGELGVSWKSTTETSVARGCYVDLGVQGYVGKREGVSANLIIGKNF
ncbi:MAG: autotransporter outer membrane beta-barrel domain-containing protein [Planctomycetaceae bacterium]|nr:autotransporter outer membrane beta-barrel domain-containing protein [Planctomycetaceae bacterium]